MISSTHLTSFQKHSTIESSNKVTMEINYNAAEEKIKYGCYLENGITAYSNTSKYDDSKSYTFFEEPAALTTISSFPTNQNQIVVANATGIATGMFIYGENIPAETTVTAISSTTITMSKNRSGTVTGTEVSFLNYSQKENKELLEYFPIESIFEPNRPDPGIVKLVAYRKNQELIGIESIKLGNFGNVYGNNRTDRLYPCYRNSGFKYWSSIRRVKSNGLLKTVGVSSGTSITHASPFVEYENYVKINKVSIKTQKYNGTYPTSFKIDVLQLVSGNLTWQTIYTASNSSVLSDGKLDIFYALSGGSFSWGTTEYANTDVSLSTGTISIKGIRLEITSMSTSRSNAEVIEVSPRLLLDITDHTISFDSNKSISNSSSSLLVGGTVTGTSSIRISNYDRYFSNKQDTYLSKYLSQGVEFKFYQLVGGGQNMESIPLGTFYSTDFSEDGDFTVSINAEDYFYFLKRLKSPEMSIANIKGIESSVAILMLLDNAGITNYNFVRKNNEDVILDFFFSNREKSVAQVLEDIATSCQYHIYINSYNQITVVTKEKVGELVSSGNTDFWMVGSEEWSVSDAEYSSLNEVYTANIQSFSDNIVNPITEGTISYAGVGIKKQPMAILKNKELFDDENIPFYNASVISRDLSYSNSLLWSIENTELESDRVLISMPYIQNISTSRPSILTTNLPEAESLNDLVRTIYNSSSSSDKQYFEIVLDQERATEFLFGNKFFGHLVIDSEIISYRGLVVNVFDPKEQSNSGKFVVFNKDEHMYLQNKASSGSSIVCYSVLVDLVYKAKRTSNVSGTENFEFEFVSDGRAQENTKVEQHTSITTTEFLNNKFAALLYSNASTSNFAVGTMSAKTVNLKDPRKPKLGNNVAYPGYFKISGAKALEGTLAVSKTDTTKDKTLVPIDNIGEQVISGFFRNITFVPQKISTRMRLLSKSKKEVNSPKQLRQNRGIGGIAFRLKASGGVLESGYFVEIEDVGNIEGSQLEKGQFENLRLYKVFGSNKKAQLLGKAFVNVSATSGESLDAGQSMVNEGRSYVSSSDLTITVEDNGKTSNITVFWETNKVIAVTDVDAINQKSSNVGMFVRSNSEALFEYIYCSSVAKGGKYKTNLAFSKGKGFMDVDKAAQRGLLPSSITSILTSDGSATAFYEDFGNQVREAKKFEVKWENPAVYAKLITLSKLNQDYFASSFSFSSHGANFWVFNTSNSSITLSSDSNTPIYVSGIAMEPLSSGEVGISDYAKNRSSQLYDLLKNNVNRYGENSFTASSPYMNSLGQAENLADWVIQRASEEKRQISLSIFPVPTLEIGDKVRVFYPEKGYSVSKIGDKVFYIQSIGYSVSESGPSMSIELREV